MAAPPAPLLSFRGCGPLLGQLAKTTSSPAFRSSSVCTGAAAAPSSAALAAAPSSAALAAAPSPAALAAAPSSTALAATIATTTIAATVASTAFAADAAGALRSALVSAAAQLSRRPRCGLGCVGCQRRGLVG